MAEVTRAAYTYGDHKYLQNKVVMDLFLALKEQYWQSILLFMRMF
jgi:hypothetical protein